MWDIHYRSAKQQLNSVALGLYSRSTKEIVPQYFAIINVNIQGGFSLGAVIILYRMIKLTFQCRRKYYCVGWNNNTGKQDIETFGTNKVIIMITQ